MHTVLCLVYIRAVQLAVQEPLQPCLLLLGGEREPREELHNASTAHALRDHSL